MSDVTPSLAPGSSYAPAVRVIGLLILLIVVVVLVTPSAAHAWVIAPLLTTVAAVGLFSLTLSGRYGSLPLDDLGLWHLGIVSLYIVLPLVVYVALGFQYTPLNDSRLFSAQPPPEFVAYVAWLHVIYLVAASAMYLWTTRGSTFRRSPVTPLATSTALAAICVWIGCEVFLTGMGIIYRLSSGSYLESYIVVQELPLVARQLYRLVTGIRVVASLFVLVWLFTNYERRKWLIAAWIGVIAAATVFGGGSRTPLMIVLAGSVILYHRFVRPISFYRAFAIGLTVILVFTGLGVWRQVELAESGEPFTLGVGTGEFDAVFGTAVDLEQRRIQHEYSIRSPALYLSEIVAPVPSQMLPFRKIDLSEWYLRSFYPEYRERGGGFAFGVVAQGIVGWGWGEILVRGLIIGLLLGALTRWRLSQGHRPVAVVVYLWFTVLSYIAFRNTTLSVFATFLQQFLPAVVVLWIGDRLFRSLAPKRLHDALPSHPPVDLA
jgi:hypothetical protein